MLLSKHKVRCLILLGGMLGIVPAQDGTSLLPRTLDSIKRHNFVVLSVGIISDRVPADLITRLNSIQTQPPRQMRIYLTQSDFIGDMYRDFNFLVNDKQVNAIIIWPCPATQDPIMIKKICRMSKMKQIPVIAFSEDWLVNGALMYIKDSDNLTIVVNEAVREQMNYPISENELYTLIYQ